MNYELLSYAMPKIMEHEGLRLKPYKCPAGKLTIGYGRNLEARGITKQEAYTLAENDIRDSIFQCEKNFSDFFSKLSVGRKYVLVDMVFNMGINGLLGFKKTLNFIRQGNYESASIEMLNSLWAKQVGNRAITLSKIMKEG